MDIAVSAFNYSGLILELLNRCRLAAKVFFVSDIADIDGISIPDRILNPSPGTIRSSTSSWTWSTAVPRRNDWNIWSDFLRTISHEGQLLPQYRLGRFFSAPHLQRGTSWVVSNDKEWIFSRSPHGDQAFQRSGDTVRNLPYYRRSPLPEPAPNFNSLDRAVVQALSTHSALLAGHCALLPTSPPPPTMESWLAGLPPGSWILDNSHLPSNGAPLAQAISTNTALGVSDGSFNFSLARALGTAAWTLNSTQGDTLGKGLTQTEGSEGQVDSFLPTASSSKAFCA